MNGLRMPEISVKLGEGVKDVMHKAMVALINHYGNSDFASEMRTQIRKSREHSAMEIIEEYVWMNFNEKEVQNA